MNERVERSLGLVRAAIRRLDGATTEEREALLDKLHHEGFASSEETCASSAEADCLAEEALIDLRAERQILAEEER